MLNALSLSRVSTVAGFVAAMHVAAASHALVVNQMFVLGDSLNDSGSAAAMTQVAPGVSFFPPSQPTGLPSPVGVPYSYRFSNGPVAVEYLAGLLGTGPSAPAWPASPGSPNFAVGGAMSGAGPINGANPMVPVVPAPLQGLCCNFNFLVDSPAGLQPNPAATPPVAGFPAVQFTGLNDQVALFKDRLGTGDIGPFDPATTLFSVWGGANDVFLALALASNPALGLTPAEQEAVLLAYTINAALNIGTRIGELAALNAQHFLVLNMPNIGSTPFATDVNRVAELTALSTLFNLVLDQTLGGLRAGFGLDIIEFDTFKAQDNLIASGTFSNTTDPCFDDSDVAQSIPRILGGCQGYLFFDGVHPTTAAHQILAQQLFAAIPEPGTVALLAAALLALGWRRRAARA